jgi:hypothetical protein
VAVSGDPGVARRRVSAAARPSKERVPMGAAAGLSRLVPIFSTRTLVAAPVQSQIF